VKYFAFDQEFIKNYSPFPGFSFDSPKEAIQPYNGPIETIDEFADFVTVYSTTEVCRDPKDNFLLSLSLDGRADFLLTGDKDLLVLEKFAETKIVTMSEFLNDSSLDDPKIHVKSIR